MKFKLVLVVLFFSISSCVENYTPKPRAFFKINLPDKQYQTIVSDCGFVFEIPLYAKIEELNKECFYDIIFPNQNATLHVTYFKLQDNLLDHAEESRNLAYKHSIVADAISEQLFINESDRIYSILYNYEGQTATSTQFYITDSLYHFFRGALYFNTEITDSLLPVNNFLKQDIKYIIQSFRWKDQ